MGDAMLGGKGRTFVGDANFFVALSGTAVFSLSEIRVLV
jgi:hypothetical protein